MPFVRTALPGLTVIGNIETGQEVVDLASSKNWMVSVDESIQFPMGLVDDVFLHVSLTRDQKPRPKFYSYYFTDQRAHYSHKPQSCCDTVCL